MGVCSSKAPVDREVQQVDEKPDFIPAGGIQFPDLPTLRKQLSEREKVRRDTALERLRIENGLPLEEEIEAEAAEEEVESSEEGRDLEDANPVLAVVKRFEMGEAGEEMRKKELDRTKSWKVDLERAKQERLIALEEEERRLKVEEEEEPLEAVEEVELVEETVGDDGIQTTKSFKINGMIQQIMERDSPYEKVAAASGVELDAETKKKIRKRRKELTKHQAELPANPETALSSNHEAVPKQTLEEFEDMVEEFILRDEIETVVQRESTVEVVDEADADVTSSLPIDPFLKEEDVAIAS